MYRTTLIFYLVLIKFCHSESTSTVITNSGKIKGHYKLSSKGNNYEAYEGIPYAMPAIGEKRFRPPEPMQPWIGELVADTLCDKCIGYHRDADANGEYVRGVEDCLYMNIYVPVRKTNTSLPVIFYIYGGSFQFSILAGTEQHCLIDHDIIFVSFNYRHGTLGFLSTEDEVVTGNMGLKDQALALKWVFENIACFGGDPKKITLAGLSAGGASVHYHYLSPMSRGLFRSGMSFSGTAFDAWAQAKDSKNKTIRLAQLVNCTIDDMVDLVKCLRSRPAHDIVSAQKYFMPWYLHEFAPFGPVIERGSSSPFIDRPPIDIISSGNVYDAPWITGVVSEEGLSATAEFMKNKTVFEDLDKNWTTIAPHLLQYYYTIPKEDHAAIANQIRKHYFGNQPITENNLFILTHLCGDRLFYVDAVKAARAQAKVNKNSVWFYYYSYRAATSLTNVILNSTINFGVSHIDDVYLGFGNSIIDPKRTAKDFAMHQDLIRFWLSVVYEGAPNFGPKWRPINKESTHLNYLHMIESSNFKEETNENWGEKVFWESIDFQENKPTDISPK